MKGTDSVGEKSAKMMLSIARLQCGGLTVDKLMELLNFIATRVFFFPYLGDCLLCQRHIVPLKKEFHV